MKKILILSLIFLSFACSKNKQNFITRTPIPELKRVHFDFDSAAIKPEMKRLMKKNIEHLQKNPNIQLVIEGHTDERGTNEYNLALGDRRADSAKKFLQREGIDENRLRTISYGEERPLKEGSSEDVWYLNRRVEFIRY